MKRSVLIICLLLIASLGCGSASRTQQQAAERLGEQLGKKMFSGKDDAQAAAEACLDMRIQSGAELFVQCYGDQFFGVVDQDVWRNTLQQVDDAVGTLESYQLLDWGTQFVGNESETFLVVQLLFETTYSNDKGTELILMSQSMDGEPFMIVGHQIQSDGLDEVPPQRL